MDCHKCNDDLTAFLDGEIAGLQRDEMESHLEKCPPCRQECEDLRGTATLISNYAADLDPAPQIWNNLRVRIMEMPAPVTPPGFFRFLVLNRWATATATMAATVLLALGLWGYMEYRQSQDDLAIYMDDYIQMRNLTERLHSLQVVQSSSSAGFATEALGPEVPENPFAEIRPVSMTNPFRAEER
jgi:hypothetical protein